MSKSFVNIESIIDQIIQGDCVASLRNIPSNSVDAIFADPPYRMQTEGVLLRTDGSKFSGVDDQWDKFETSTEYDTFCKQWLAECKRILKPNGSIWVIGSFQNIYRIGYIMSQLGYWIINDIVWSKPNAVPNFAGTRFQNSHETLLWCVKDQKAKYTFNYKTMKHLNGGKQDKSIWNISICIGNERLKDKNGQKIHSTQKPERLLYKVILSSTKEGDIVLDPFFGTGTTGAIAKRLKRHFIGIEREGKYIDAAKKRIDLVVPKLDEIENLSLEIKPPQVSMKKLVENNFLEIGENLFDKNSCVIGSITKTGLVDDGEDELSIHKMSAKKLGQTNHNGWDYFYCMRKNKLVPINEFRYKYQETINGSYK